MQAEDATRATAHAAELEGCDFLDFGCKIGGSFAISEKCLGGTRGLGIDNNVAHVDAFRRSGGRAIVGDVTALELPDKCVRFVTISHVLEHLPSMEHVRLAVIEATRVATDFVAIIGPFFDADTYLASQGVKFYWSDWTYHPTHVESAGLSQILYDEGLTSFTCWGRYPVTSTADDTLLPLDAPRNQQKYDAAVHPPKPPAKRLDKPVFKEIVLLVLLRPIADLDGMLSNLKVAAPLGPYTQVDVLYAKHGRG